MSDDIKKRVDNRNKLIDKLGGSKVDLSNFYAELKKEAKAEEEERYKRSKEARDREEAKRQEKRDEVQRLINATAKKTSQENQAKADKEIAEAKAKAEAELNQAISKKHGVKSKEELEKDNAYKSMLDGLKLKG